MPWSHTRRILQTASLPRGEFLGLFRSSDGDCTLNTGYMGFALSRDLCSTPLVACCGVPSEKRAVSAQVCQQGECGVRACRGRSAVLLHERAPGRPAQVHQDPERDVPLTVELSCIRIAPHGHHQHRTAARQVHLPSHARRLARSRNSSGCDMALLSVHPEGTEKQQFERGTTAQVRCQRNARQAQGVPAQREGHAPGLPAGQPALAAAPWELQSCSSV